MNHFYQYSFFFLWISLPFTALSPNRIIAWIILYIWNGWLSIKKNIALWCGHLESDFILHIFVETWIAWKFNFYSSQAGPCDEKISIMSILYHTFWTQQYVMLCHSNDKISSLLWNYLSKKMWEDYPKRLTICSDAVM